MLSFVKFSAGFLVKRLIYFKNRILIDIRMRSYEK